MTRIQKSRHRRFHRYWSRILEKKNSPTKKKSPGRDGEIEKDREDVDSHQGTETLVVFVRKSSRESGIISMSSFLVCNKAQVSQIYEGDKYLTIGVVLTVITMCISSMRPTTVCSVTRTNNSLTPTGHHQVEDHWWKVLYV
jgi:hypothetical protein